MARKKEVIILREAIEWIQVNDAVVPVVQRRSSNGRVHHLIPLSVVRYSALVRDLSTLKSFGSSAFERERLSEICRRAGFRFCFPRDTELFSLTDFVSRFKDKVYIAVLPAVEPFQHLRVFGSTDQPGQSEGRTNGTGAEVDDLEVHQHKSNPQPLDLSKHRTMNSAVDLELEKAVDKINASDSSLYFELSHEAIVRQLHGKNVVCLEKNAVEYVTLQNLHAAFFRQVPSDVFLAAVTLVGLPSVDLPPEYRNVDVRIPAQMIRLEDACAAVDRLKTVLGRTTAIGNEISARKKNTTKERFTTEYGCRQEDRCGFSADASLCADESHRSKKRGESPMHNKRKRLFDTISQLHLKKNKKMSDGVI